MSRELEDMCVVCKDHNKPSCGFEERGSQSHCPYNELIEKGYRLAEQDLALTAEDVSCIFHLCGQFNNDFAKVAEVFNKDREEENETQ